MNLKRNRKESEPFPVKPDNSLCTFKEGGAILGGISESTMRKMAGQLGFTIVDLNDVLPKPIKNHLRLIKSEVESIRDMAIEKAHQHKTHHQEVVRNALIN
jgi:hypothetical protein